MAIAMVVIAMLLGTILVPLQSQVESRKYDETQKILDQAREALLGYAAANGYFPCPADSTSNGQEASGTDHSISDSCPASVRGSNDTYIGFLPAATLGFTPVDSSGYAVDAWGLTVNRIRYAVTRRSISGVRPFVTQNGIRTAGMSNVLSNTNLLKICSSGLNAIGTACGAGVTALAENVPIVVWSLGPNAGTSGGAAPHEDKNLAATRVFVKRDKSDVSGNEFDDVVTWISSPMVFNRLIAAGQLP